MPPKKKKGKGKGKGKKKSKDGAALELDDKYKKTVDEIEALKDHLATRKELTRRAMGAEDNMKARMNDTQKELEEHKADQKSINAEMAMQYKIMQTQMGMKLHKTQMELVQTQNRLRDTERKLRETEEEKERMIKEKDGMIEKLNLDIIIMEKDYGRILDESLNSLVAKIEGAKSRWEVSASNLQARNKQNLLELGLHPLEI